MAAPTNLDFETPGGAVGSLDAWAFAAGNSGADPTWLAAGWNQFETTGSPASNPAVPFLAPNDFGFGGGHWTNSNVNVDADASASPDGTSDADRMRANFVDTIHFIAEADGPRTFKAGVRYTVGCHFKFNGSATDPAFGPRIDFGGGHVVGLTPDIGGSLPSIILRTPAPLGPVESLSGEVVAAGSNWVNVALSFVLSVDTAAAPGFGFNAGGTESFPGGNTGHYIWGAYIYAGELTAAEDFAFAWASGTYAFALVLGTNAIGALFGNGTTLQTAIDGFEGGWGNTPFYTELDDSLTLAAVWDSGGTNLGVETFSASAGWDATYDSFSTTACLFDAAGTNQAFDSFEVGAGWDATYATGLSGTVTAFFNGPVVSIQMEDFEHVVDDILYTPDFTTDTMTAAGHGLLANTVVRLVNVGGAFPGTLVRTLDYFVVTVTTNTFQLSLTSGGAAINFTDNGTGDQYVRGSGVRYWVQPDGINPTI